MNEYVLLASIMLDGGLSPLYVATSDYYTQPTDSIGYVHFEARIIRTPIIDVSIGCYVWGSKSSTSVGQIVLADPANTLDVVGQLGSQRDARVEMRLARIGQSYDDATIVCLALIDEISRSGGNVVIKLRSTDAWLDRPVCNSFFDLIDSPSSSSSSSTTDDVIDATSFTRNLTDIDEIAGDPVPVVIGRVYQHDAPLVSAPQLIHQITDANVVDLERVMSGGNAAIPAVEYVEAFDGAGWKWLVTPSARVLCDLDGFGAIGEPLVFGDFAGTPPSTDGIGGWSIDSDQPEPIYRAGVGLEWSDGGEIFGNVGSSEIPKGYVVVVLEVAFLGPLASIDVAAAYPVSVTRPGRWARVLPASDVVTLTMSGRVVLRSAAVYPVTDESSSTLTEMIRHLSIARAAIHTGTRETVTEIDTDFDSLTEFEQWESEITGNAIVADAIWDNDDEAAELIIVAGTTSSGSVSIEWPVDLPPGPYTMQATTFLARAGDGRIAAQIIATPVNTSIIDVPALAIANAGDGVQTHDVAFDVPFAWRLRVVLSATNYTAVYQLRDIVLQRTQLALGSDVIDIGTVARIDNGAQIGAVFSGRETVAEAINYALTAVCGYYYTTPDGRIAFGKLQDFSAALPRVEVTSDRLASWPDVTVDFGERLSDRWAAGRNWQTYDDADLAGITFPNRPPFRAQFRHVVKGSSVQRYAPAYTHAIGAPAIETCLYSQADVQLEADRVSDLYTAERAFVQFDYLASSAVDAATLRPGMYARLSATEFPDSVRGGIGLIISVSNELRTLTVRITCWLASSATSPITASSSELPENTLVDDIDNVLVDDDDQPLE